MKFTLVSEIWFSIAVWGCLVRLVATTRGPEWCCCMELVATRGLDALLSYNTIMCAGVCGLIVGDPAGMFQCQFYPVVLLKWKWKEYSWSTNGKKDINKTLSDDQNFLTVRGSHLKWMWKWCCENEGIESVSTNSICHDIHKYPYSSKSVMKFVQSQKDFSQVRGF